MHHLSPLDVSVPYYPDSFFEKLSIFIFSFLFFAVALVFCPLC